MRAEANAVVRLGAPADPLTETRHAYLRYVGQGHEVKVTLPAEPTPKSTGAIDGVALRRAFEAEYRAQYGRTVPDLDIEALTWSLTVAAARPPSGRPHAPPERIPAPAASQQRRLRAPDTDGPLDASVYRRGDLAPGMEIDGPALVVEDQTTTVVPLGASATVNGRGDLVLRLGRAEAHDSAGHRAAAASPELRRQVIWNRMISIVEEQAQALIRTAFSSQCHGRLRRLFPRALSARGNARRRRLCDQRPLARHRSPLRLHRRHPDLPRRPSGRAVRLHRARG
jgi:hypothetical protein